MPNKFLSISSLPQTAYRSSFHTKPPGFGSPVAAPGELPPSGMMPPPPVPGAGGAFAGFGVGGGGVLGGTNWRGKRG